MMHPLLAPSAHIYYVWDEHLSTRLDLRLLLDSLIRDARQDAYNHNARYAGTVAERCWRDYSIWRTLTYVFGVRIWCLRSVDADGAGNTGRGSTQTIPTVYSYIKIEI